MLYTVKNKKPEEASGATSFARKVEGIGPVAHGTLSLVNKRCASRYCRACRAGVGHPSWIFAFRMDGKARCMHVQPRHVEAIRKAIENGKKVERMVLEEGIAFIERLREEDAMGRSSSRANLSGPR